MHQRYPGTRPFQDTERDRLLFKGREDDVQRFLHLVLAERLVVLFSKSGAGKSSLLNAGVSPSLRERGYVPIPIRLNDSQKPLIDLIDGQVRQAAADRHLEFVAGNTSSLLEYIRSCEFWGAGDVLLTPVLIFDQFEEMFTLDYSREQQNEFFRQLAKLIQGHTPGSPGQKTETQTKKVASTPPDVKVVLSLREEYLAHLEEIHADIPSIFRNRFRLRSLTPAQARRAIIEPALLGNSQFASRPFTYEDQTVDAMLGFLQKGGTEIAERPGGSRRLVPWVLVGLGIALFSYIFDPVIGTLGDSVIFMRQPAVLSIGIAFASLILAYYFPLKPVYVVTAALVFQLVNLARYWSAVGGTDLSVESKIILTALIGAFASGWIAWLRWRQFPKPLNDSRTERQAEIETPQIQLLCQHVEQTVLRKQSRYETVSVSLHDLGGEEGMQNILRDFYRVQMKQLSPAQWWVAHTLCENGLISMSGRRLSLDGEFIADKYKVSRALLDELIAKHLLRAESRLGSHYYELTHDSLVKPIQEAARERLRRTRILLLLGVCCTVLFFVGKDLMEKASAAKELVEARKTLRTASLMLDEMRLGSSGHDSMVVLLSRVDSILRRQDSVLGLGALERGVPPPKPPDDPVRTSPQPEERSRISGRIVDNSNRGIGQAVIVLDGNSFVSDANGAFAIEDLRMQKYQLRISREGFRETTLVDIEPGRALLTVQLGAVERVQREPVIAGSLGGRVVDSDNDAVEGAVVNVEGSARRQTQSGRDGRFSLNNLPYGMYRMKVSGFGYEELRREGINLNTPRMDLGNLRILQTIAMPVLQNPNDVVAEYPREALASRVSGSVRIRALIDPQGNVANVQVLEGVHPLLDSAAVRAARRGIFQGGGYWKTKYPFRHPASQ
ncbi:MAG: TonB family protein [Bacteroidetes bacterium]|nr:TonB family protein [Bacteroidota bacterium]MCW5897265.1 TonB family protein [Bacteroidota bacterium]